jgi:hypothetical protein
MSDTKDTGTDRRTLIAAAAAAGVAAGGPAAAFNPQPDPPGKAIQIKVDLGGVRLPEDQAAALGAEIQHAVLVAVGRAGIKGHAGPARLGPGIYGIIYRPTVKPTLTGNGRSLDGAVGQTKADSSTIRSVTLPHRAPLGAR